MRPPLSGIRCRRFGRAILGERDPYRNRREILRGRTSLARRHCVAKFRPISFTAARRDVHIWIRTNPGRPHRGRGKAGFGCHLDCQRDRHRGRGTNMCPSRVRPTHIYDALPATSSTCPRYSPPSRWDMRKGVMAL